MSVIQNNSISDVSIFGLNRENDSKPICGSVKAELHSEPTEQQQFINRLLTKHIRQVSDLQDTSVVEDQTGHLQTGEDYILAKWFPIFLFYFYFFKEQEIAKLDNRKTDMQTGNVYRSHTRRIKEKMCLGKHHGN